MKSSQVLASLLFGSFAAAAPFKRDIVQETKVVYETVVVFTTVWDDEPVAEATTTAGGYFYEQPASSVAADTTPAATSTPAYTPAYTPSAVKKSSSVYTPPVQTPSPSSAAASSTVVVVSSSAPAPAPVETSATPAPVEPTTTTTEAAYTPAPVTSAAPAPATSSAAASPPSSGGSSYSGDVTVYDTQGGYGACGKALSDTDMIVALASTAWGVSSYDAQTGDATNPWCGQKITIEANGKTATATIMDMCPGCTGDDIDLSRAAWKAIGMTEDTRIKGTWSKAS
ncbi:hypothetical protein N0V94_001332 [Neodidymelliopsis sp. IMI 364377]|nr:hypothetical protein N0V94_001332 [Neodidymelliopsis sp. IMI 364377]